MDKYCDVLKAMEAYAADFKVPIISREGGRLLKETVATKEPVSILEIGTAIGYSTVLMASAMSPSGRIVTIELDEQRTQIAKKNLAVAGVADKVKMITGDAGEVLTGLTDRFDFVFIDAAKGQYLDYLFKVMDKLTPGAVVVADNVLFRGWVLEGNDAPRRFRTIIKRLRAYIEFVTTDSRFDSVIHQIGDGMAISHYQGRD